MDGIREQLLAILTADDPDYDRAAAFGPDALPVVGEMVGEDMDLAAAAVYVAGLIPSHESLAIIAKAAGREEPEVRASAAGALEKFASHPQCADDLDAAADVLAPLLEDEDASVRWIARHAATSLPVHGAR